jgi:hypothetical protein
MSQAKCHLEEEVRTLPLDITARLKERQAVRTEISIYEKDLVILPSLEPDWCQADNHLRTLRNQEIELTREIKEMMQKWTEKLFE